MENRFWTVTYRNRDNDQRITAAVFAADQRQAQEKAQADGRIDDREVWEIESVEPHEETLARILVAEFSEKQQGGHFACPRCGKMTMDAESVTRNALSRRATVHICDACGMQEALEDMMDSITPLTAWAIAAAPENWRMRRHYSAAAWAREQYTDRWNDCPYFRDMVERGEIPADYIGRRTVMIHAPIKGTVLLTEGYHFTVDDEEGRQYL